MAYFISFYREIPDTVAPRDYSQYQVGGSYPLGGSPDMTGFVEAAIARFEQFHGVTSWREVAHHYNVSEVDYI